MLPVAFTLLAASCSGGADAVATYNDSLSYSAGVYMARNLRQIAVEQMGVHEDCIDDFLRGVKDAFPLEQNEASAAYTAGLITGINAVEMMEKGSRLLADGEAVEKSLNPAQFIEGVIAAVGDNGSLMPVDDAVDYFNSSRYREKSEAFMAKNATREGVQLLPGGLQYKIKSAGNGAVATAEDAVLCVYRATFPDGRTFESSRGKAVEITLDTVIPGFAQALQLLPEGSSAKIYIPWQLAYGAKGVNNIPPYSAVIFDVEIIRVIKDDSR